MSARRPITILGVLLLVTAAILAGGSGSAQAGGSKTGAVYVALGDSYAAGEGLGGWEAGTDVASGTKKNMCHRSSSDAYASLGRNPALVLPDVTDRAFWACSSAKVWHVLNGLGYGEPKQINTVGRSTKFISLSVGGNDIDFGDIGTNCLKTYEAGVTRPIPLLNKRSCYDQIKASIKKLPTLKSDLSAASKTKSGFRSGLYRQLLDRAAPDAVLVVAGYPRIFPDNAGGLLELNGKRFCETNTWWISTTLGVPVPVTAGVEAEDVNQQINSFMAGKDGLNATIKKAVETVAADPRYKGRILYADTWNAADSKPINCNGGYVHDQTVNGVMLSPGANGMTDRNTFTNAIKRLFSSATFHPTKAGQEMIGRAVDSAFRRGRELTGVAEVSTNGASRCARLTDGRVKCWGSNYVGMLGIGTYDTGEVAHRPSLVNGLTGATGISAGTGYGSSAGFSLCAVTNGGQVKCWGTANEGALGDGEFSWGSCCNSSTGSDYGSALPRNVLGLNDAVQVSSSDSGSCAVRRSGQVVCWGSGESGELGNGRDRITEHTVGWGVGYGKATPVDVLGINDATQVSRSSETACAVLKTGKVMCWGRGDLGTLGDGHAAQFEGFRTTDSYWSAIPVEVKGISEAVQISLGTYSACALLKSGRVMCWGRNNFGQLGNGQATPETNSFVFSAEPVEVDGLRDAVMVSAGFTSCAVLKSGKVSCWGLGGRGQLGNGAVGTEDNGGESYSEPRPVSVRDISNATQVSTSLSDVCARLADYRVMCWGANDLGSNGERSLSVGSTDAIVPVPMSVVN